MERYELIVIGAGPAGLSAAIEAAKAGMRVIVFDENAKPGGQLFKQIHKFFGSKEHKAKIRGFRIGEALLQEATSLNVTVRLNATVMGLFANKEITVMTDDRIEHYKGDSIVIATGASENMIPFEGWTLPGVIGAGAAQTMMNLHGVKPGERILMVGSGNVGLVVSFQLKQAGCDVVAVVDASPRVGGYGVHAAKVARTGVPFYMAHTVVRAEGDTCVTGAVIAEVDSSWQTVAGSEKHIEVDTICLAVGLSPMAQLARMAGCEMQDSRLKGGMVPICDASGETTVPGIFAAGDVAGIEEASSAMVQGRIAGAAAAKTGGYMTGDEFNTIYDELQGSLSRLRQGMFCHENKGRTDLTTTDEGYALSGSLLGKGYIEEAELCAFPCAAGQATGGAHVVIECTQNIPCNPCQDACPKGCITVGSCITSLPQMNADSNCSGCGQCVAVCPGQAIFLVDEDIGNGYASVTIPYEFFPYPEAGDAGTALDRSGTAVCEAEVISLKAPKSFDATALLTMRVPADMAGKARFFKGGAA